MVNIVVGWLYGVIPGGVQRSIVPNRKGGRGSEGVWYLFQYLRITQKSQGNRTS